MPQHSRDPQVPASWRSAWTIVAVCLVVLAAATALLPCPDPKSHGVRLVLCLLALESVLLAVVAPFLAARGSGGRLRSVLLPLVAVVLIGIVLFAAAARGAVPLSAILWSHLFLLSFAWLLAALALALVTLRLRAATAQLVVTLLALLMLGQVFFANSLVEAAAGERSKMLVIDAVLWTNPWLIVGGSILQADPLRSENLYEWSVIIYYGFQYPGSSISAVWLRALFLTGVYAGCAGLLQALAWLIARRRRRPGVVQGPDNL